MSDVLDKIAEKLKNYREELLKADLNAKKIPEVKDSADIDDGKKMIEEKHMNGKNVEQYNHKGEKVVHDRVPKKVADLSKGEEQRAENEGGQKMMAPPEPEPEGLKDKRQPVTHDECGRPFGKEEKGAILPKHIHNWMNMPKDQRDSHPDAKIFREHAQRIGLNPDSLKVAKKEKEFGSYEEAGSAIDSAFSEADFNPKTKHPKDPTAGMPPGKKVGERTTGTGFKLKSVKKQEVIKYDNNGQWSIEKSNYGPKDMNLYNPTDNIKRKAKNTGDVVEDAGKNVNTKSYTTSGSNMQQAHESAEAKRQAAKTKASTKTLKDFSPEEIKAMEAKANVKKGEMDGVEVGGSKDSKNTKTYDKEFEKKDFNGSITGGSENDKNTRL